MEHEHAERAQHRHETGGWHAETFLSRKRANHVAYFCMEYGLDPSLQIYCGGLGILAGDHLKAARDLKLPLVGLGLLWQQGFAEQELDAAGEPYEAYKHFAYDFLRDTGVTMDVAVRRRNVRCKVWECTRFGNAPLYLLDNDVDGCADRQIADTLYGGNTEQRVAQEMVLGIGGVRALGIRSPFDLLWLPIRSDQIRQID